MINKFIKNKIKPKLNGLSNITEIHRQRRSRPYGDSRASGDKTPESSVSKSSDVGTGKGINNSQAQKKPRRRKDLKYIVFKV